MITNSRLHAAIALGGTLVIGGFAAFVPPVPPASAQSHAQRLCREQGVPANAGAYDYCVGRATRAIAAGEPATAHLLARVAVQSQEACLHDGLEPRSEGFKRCLQRETTARSLLIYADEAPTYGPQVAAP